MTKVQVRNHLIAAVLSSHTYTPEYEKSTRLHAEYEAQKLLNSGVTVLPKKCIYKEMTGNGETNYMLDVIEHTFVHGELYQIVVEDYRGSRYLVPITEFDTGKFEWVPNAIT